MEEESNETKASNCEKETNTRNERNFKNKFDYLENDPQKEQLINIYNQLYSQAESPKIEDIQKYINQTRSKIRFKRLEGVIMLAKLLELDENIHIQRFLNSGVTSDLIGIILHSKEHLLRAEALKCLAIAISGNEDQTRYLESQKVLELLIDSSKEDYIHLVEMAVRGLGNITGKSKSYRSKIYQHGGLDQLLKIYEEIREVEEEGPRMTLKLYTIWTISNLGLLGSTLKEEERPKLLIIFLESLKFFLKNIDQNFCNIPKFIKVIFSALARIVSDNSEKLIKSYKRLKLMEAVILVMQILKVTFWTPRTRIESDYKSTIFSFFLFVKNLTFDGGEFTTIFVQNHGLEVLMDLIKFREDKIRHKVSRTVSFLIQGTERACQAVLEHPTLFSYLMTVSSEDVYLVREETIHTLAGFTIDPSEKQLIFLLRENYLEWLNNLIRNEEDGSIVNIALNGILNILRHGESKLKLPCGVDNPIVQKMKRKGMDKLIIGLRDRDQSQEIDLVYASRIIDNYSLGDL